MFRGVNRLNLDAKGRLAVPTRYRERLQERCAAELVVTIDLDHCLLIYPLPEWQEIERKLMKLPSFNKAARNLQRLLVGHATEVEMDGQGRVLLPPALRDFAHLDKHVVLIGQGNKFELWDEERWNSQREGWLGEVDLNNLDLPAEFDTFSI
ncbi:division/cell wall cluster transcriptional repressor MraZ [Sedimenticola hydrogenitrophicus]|uniref:division/cell wall cluster transcriptional repressor MraZ n=1 Tax=Sedimenticola hydrogenitrophicus TaxID=2967975 RepID=UPI0021A7BC56|nr:division/cell wall cluster transcriptional repressor MraZ [Sedimenticola hydrogenitrophicus]